MVNLHLLYLVLERHSEQYPGWSKEDYCNYAVWLAEQAPKTGGIRGYEVGKNIVVRYDPYNNDYVKADAFTGLLLCLSLRRKPFTMKGVERRREIKNETLMSRLWSI